MKVRQLFGIAIGALLGATLGAVAGSMTIGPGFGTYVGIAIGAGGEDMSQLSHRGAGAFSILVIARPLPTNTP
jgi:hypothetical protein